MGVSIVEVVVMDSLWCYMWSLSSRRVAPCTCVSRLVDSTYLDVLYCVHSIV
jgi:hypothetical protein